MKKAASLNLRRCGISKVSFVLTADVRNIIRKGDKWVYECKKCSFRTTLRSGTVMHGSKLPFRYWFIAMHLLTSTKKSFSAREIQRQLSHKRYQPIWGMLHKLRQAMGKRDELYQLGGSIELDEGFFSTEVAD